MQPHRTALEAWRYLRDEGGIEPDGRDVALVQMLKGRLDAHAPSLDDALEAASMEGFLNALFGVLSPFIGMMTDLLEYFEAAQATEGPEEWVLLLGDGAERLEVNLDHFRKWIEKATARRKDRRKVPALDRDGLWAIQRHFWPLGKRHEDARGQAWYSQPEPRQVEPDLAAWRQAYEAGNYLPALPANVYRLLRTDGPVGDVAAILVEIHTTILALTRSREVLERLGHWSADLESEGDFWSTRGLWQLESDQWMKGRVLDLAAWAEAPSAMQSDIEDSLRRQFEKVPRRIARIDISIQDLEEILSLPVWKRRYELYSAWILTRILKSLKGHQIALHHENGRIEFAFRETRMATILSTDPPMDIFSEKRTAADADLLKGHGRTGGVQPDYSVWETSGTCRLAVECKHYKRSSTQNFSEALNDYTAALGTAYVVLANYGPVGANVEKAVQESRRERCSALGFVNPEGEGPLAQFSKIVRKVIGEPDPFDSAEILQLARPDEAPILLIDVSGSMQAAIDGERGRKLVANLIRFNHVRTVAAADTALRAESGTSPGEIDELLAAGGGDRTSLQGPVETLLRKGSVLVLTDEEGYRQLDTFQVARMERIDAASGQLYLVHVNGRSAGS